MMLARSVGRHMLVASAISLLAVACGGRSIGNDDLTGTPDPTDPSPIVPNDAGPDAPTQCNGVNLACDPGDQSVGSEAACGDADYCYSRTGCPGSILWCAHHTVQCGAVPRCDKGDDEVAACPDGGPNSSLTCYPRTVCSSTILCVHHDGCAALPSCNPGDVEVTDIGTCSMKGISCYPVTECNYTIHCYTP
jgi:hypothetical protein